MKDLEMLEHTIWDDEEEEMATEGVAETAKVLAAIAAALALGAALIVIVKKVKKSKAAKKEAEALKGRTVVGDLDYCDEMMKDITNQIKKLKDQRTAFKKKQAADKAAIKAINKSIKEMKGFVRPVSKLAKSASVPMSKIAALSNSIQDKIEAQPKFKKESADEYENELLNLFESVTEKTEAYYEESESADDFSLDDIIG